MNCYDKKLKHLEFIQNVITRMNANSFLIKGWCITLVAAVFAIKAGNPDFKFFLIPIVIIPVFWLLDGFFLSQERQYRDLYNKVRLQSEEEIDFSMNASSYNYDRNTWLSSTTSSTLNVFYGCLAGLIYLVPILLSQVASKASG